MTNQNEEPQAPEINDHVERFMWMNPAEEIVEVANNWGKDEILETADDLREGESMLDDGRVVDSENGNFIRFWRRPSA